MTENNRHLSGELSHMGSAIREDMRLLSSDGQEVGTVDGLEGTETIKLKRKDSIDGQHHYLSVDDVVRVEEDQAILRLTYAEAQERLVADASGSDAHAEDTNPEQHLENSGPGAVGPFDQKEGTAIGQNPDEPDRMVS